MANAAGGQSDYWKVLTLTSYSDEESVMGAIMSGASGYLLKEIGAQGILDAITRISEGQRLLDPTVTAKVLERVRHGDEEDRGWAELSERERQILELISEGQTNKEIAERYTLATRRKRTT